MSQLVERIKSWLRWQAGRSRKKWLGKYTFALAVDAQWGQFLVDPEDMGVGAQLARHGVYSSDELTRLLKLTPVDGDVLIVGAHVGTLLVPMAKHCANVVGIEANPKTFQLLSMNVSINQLTNVEIHQLAASDSAGTISFLQNTANSGGSKRAPNKADWRYDYDAPKQIEVPAVRLDDLLDGRRFDMIVMDIEGSEYFALSGMQRLLTYASTLIVEFVPHHLRSVANVSVTQFLSRVPMHLNEVTLPGQKLQIDRSQLETVLESMMNRDISEDGVIFRSIPVLDSSSTGR